MSWRTYSERGIRAGDEEVALLIFDELDPLQERATV